MRKNANDDIPSNVCDEYCFYSTQSLVLSLRLDYIRGRVCCIIVDIVSLGNKQMEMESNHTNLISASNRIA